VATQITRPVSPFDFYLWGCLKYVYITHPWTIKDLKIIITSAIQEIITAVLRVTSSNQQERFSYVLMKVEYMFNAPCNALRCN
jgi:predicted RecB family endonuclease